MLLKCSITLVFTCPLFSRCTILSLFRENNNMVLLPFPLQIFMPLVNLWFIRLQGQFPTLRTRSCPDLCSFIRPPRMPLAFGRKRILIPGFIRTSPMLAVYGAAQSLPLGGVGRDLSFIKDDTRRLLYLNY